MTALFSTGRIASLLESATGATGLKVVEAYRNQRRLRHSGPPATRGLTLWTELFGFEAVAGWVWGTGRGLEMLGEGTELSGDGVPISADLVDGKGMSLSLRHLSGEEWALSLIGEGPAPAGAVPLGQMIASDQRFVRAGGGGSWVYRRYISPGGEAGPSQIVLTRLVSHDSGAAR